MDYQIKLEISKKWEKIGFTKEVLGDHWVEITNLMENQILYNKLNKSKIDNLAIPIISRVFSNNNILDIINFGTMLNPVSNLNENFQLIARTRILKTKFILPQTSEPDELNTCKILSKSISAEIGNEVLSNLYEKAGTVLDHQWKNKNYLKNIYSMLYQGIKNKSGEFPNWIVTNRFLAEDLTETFVGEVSETNDQYLNKYSTIRIEDNNIKIYINNLLNSSILSGNKQKNKGYYYHSYVFLSESEGQIYTRYGKTLTPDGSSCFGKINIINYNEIGD